MDSMDALDELEDRLGHCFKRRELLVAALTHRSFANEHNADHNERLEFLGDAVLSLVTAEILFERYPRADEGVLTQYRAGLVRAAKLAELAEVLGLGPHLRLGVGEDTSGGRARESVLAAALEATVCALYLDGGLDVASRFLEPYLSEELRCIEDAGTGPHSEDAKSLFQVRAQGALSGMKPRYRVIRSLVWRR